MPTGPPCPHQPCEETAATRHTHEWKPPKYAQQQCSCGTRSWRLTTGGPLPDTVACAKGAHRSRINTAVARDRSEYRREVASAPQQPVF